MVLIKDTLILQHFNKNHLKAFFEDFYTSFYFYMRRLFFGYLCTKKITFPKKIKKFSFIRSPHVNNKAHEQFGLFLNKTALNVFHFSLPNTISFYQYSSLFFTFLKENLNLFFFTTGFNFKRKLVIPNRMEYSQEVRHRFLISRYRGSNPLTPII